MWRFLLMLQGDIRDYFILRYLVVMSTSRAYLFWITSQKRTHCYFENTIGIVQIHQAQNADL